MKSLLVEISHIGVNVMEIDVNDKDTLSDYKKYIGCDWLDFSRLLCDNNTYYQVVVDDIGIENGSPISYVNFDTNQVFYGSFIITKVEYGGESVSLDDEDIKFLKELLY